MDPMLCMIIPWPCNFAPSGWKFCQGQVLQVGQYQAVYSLLGNVFGGSGTTSFGVPDLRGRTVVGASVGNTPLGPTGIPYSFGTSIGKTTTEPALLQASQVPLATHTHVAVFTPPSLNGVSATLQAVQAPGASSTPSNGNYLCIADTATGDSATLYGPKPASATTANLAGVSVSGGALSGGSVSIQPAGGNAVAPVALSFQTPAVVMQYLIAFEGLYPTRD